MWYRSLMTIKSIVCLFLGIPILFAPKTLYGLFDAELGTSGSFAAQEYAAAMLGLMLLTWFARNAGPSAARHAIILGLFVYDALGVIITLIAIFVGVMNGLGWLVVVVYLFFAVGFGSLLTAKANDKNTPLAA